VGVNMLISDTTASVIIFLILFSNVYMLVRMFKEVLRDKGE